MLQQVGLHPHCCPADVDESPRLNESPAQLVSRLAELKATTCRQERRVCLPTSRAQELFLGADTIIDLDGQAVGKPEDKEHALSILSALSNRQHQVHSGVCVFNAELGFKQTIMVTTDVKFGEIVPAMAEQYWQTGEPAGKAGAYAIQGIGAQFVACISGSYSNVVGLPLFETVCLLRQAGVKAL